MADVAQDILDSQRERATAQQLIDVRKRFDRAMIVRTGGFRYEAIFGSDQLRSYDPHILVRVELNQKHDGSNTHYFRFDVSLDFNIYKDISVKDAQKLKKAVDKAVKKAKWAEDLVHGLVWSWETISSLEAE